jgi:hypothetical protein
VKDAKQGFSFSYYFSVEHTEVCGCMAVMQDLQDHCSNIQKYVDAWRSCRICKTTAQTYRSMSMHGGHAGSARRLLKHAEVCGCMAVMQDLQDHCSNMSRSLVSSRVTSKYTPALVVQNSVSTLGV